MLFSSWAILSNATLGGVVLLFAIGSFKKQTNIVFMGFLSAAKVA